MSAGRAQRFRLLTEWGISTELKGWPCLRLNALGELLSASNDHISARVEQFATTSDRMRVCRSTLAGFALAALARCTAGLGARIFPTLRNLQLAADLGLDPTMALLHRKEFRTAVANCAAADVPTEYAEVCMLPEIYASEDLSNMAEQIPIDHDDLSVGTYKNRYWVSEEHYLPGGPVFVYDVGEMDAEQPAKTYLTNSTSFFKKMLKEFHGIGIAWEHRYVIMRSPSSSLPAAPIALPKEGLWA